MQSEAVDFGLGVGRFWIIQILNGRGLLIAQVLEKNVAQLIAVSAT
jgi:hypothetical protein